DKMANECNACKKTGIDLKKCSKCQTTLYCSRDCQKADWKSHKKVCNSNAQNHLPDKIGCFDVTHNDGLKISPPVALMGPSTNRTPVSMNASGSTTVRRRTSDYVKFDGLAEAGSVQGGATDPESSFRRFLQAVEAKPELLPPWWDDTKKEACVQLGRSGDAWSHLRRAVEKAEVVEHYGDTSFAMQLRLFGEQVFGHTPGTFGNGAQVIEGMMRMEVPSDLVWSRAHLGF
ncbi:MYND domain protein, partial [Apiospora aurea]